MIQIYCGEGKGKTSAAVGAAIRAAGQGLRVLFIQFLKDGDSGEMAVLRRLPEVTVKVAAVPFVLFTSPSPALKEACAALLAQAAGTDFHMIVLDEGVTALELGALEEEALLSLLKAEGTCREWILTGRDPSPALLETADYISRIRAERHPFERGIPARKGIEYR